MNTDIKYWIHKFIEESNAIEGINRAVTKEEVKETFRFIALDEITLEELQQFVSVMQPDALLRDKEGMDVKVGNHFPPKGGQYIKDELALLLEVMLDGDPFYAHKSYESLHPFMDGNGRSGRAIWLWQMLKLKKNFAPMGFLQSYYYQSLSKK